MKKYRIIAVCVSAAVICTAVLLCRSDGRDSTGGIPAATDADRTFYLFLQGWKGEEIASQEITIPQTTGVVYAEYAALQQAQGLPLGDYAGRQAIRYTYRLEQSDLYAELVCADGILIGAMCYDPCEGTLLGIEGGTA